MSGYDIDRKLVFTTLAIGILHINTSMLLIQSVMKFTSSDIYVVTDLPEEFEHHLRYFGPRLHVIDIRKYEHFVTKIDGKFNYHLKCIAVYLTSKEVSQTLIYIDADTFLFGWDKSISRYIHGFENTLMARFREKVKENTSMAKFIPEKALAHGVDYTTIESRLAVETIMVLTRGKQTTDFLDEWKRITDHSITNSIDPFIEAFELSLALEYSGMPTMNVTNATPFADNFRTLHHDKIISTYII